MADSDITAYVLVGGSSRRMGVDKLFLQIEGRTLLERTIDTCKACFGQVKLVAGEVDKFLVLGYPVVVDSPEARGPMAGIIAALEDCRRDYCFVTAADLPDLSTDVIDSLINRYRGQQYLGLIEPHGLQPLCGLYHKSSLEAFYRCAHENEYRIAEVLKELYHAGIQLPEGPWRNVNRPDDLGRDDTGD